ncbi:MAG: helix-turn-helix transcriptional regulator [Pseudomonadota bacterium]
MEKSQFKEIRGRLGKTQKEMAQLIGTSIKAVHSYEQGWRKIPHHVEKQLLFLLSRVCRSTKPGDDCWNILNCSQEKRENCPAWEFNSGDLCWFINGTNCSGRVHKTWEDKIEECRACKVFANFFNTEKGE